MRSNRQISKFLSLVLRHRPAHIGLSMDENGWVDVVELLEKLPFEIDLEKLNEVVETNDKKRFAFSENHEKIRANQGHSINIDLALTPSEPPEILYHGTAKKSLPSIKGQGLKHGKRRHVHLSADEDTAHKVGSRHGEPVVLKVFSGKMYREGFSFFCSENGVWLTEHVPKMYLD